MSEAGSRQVLADLLRRTRDGDHAAFQTLYERTSAKLFGVICRICDNRELAREALQESYVTIWQKAQLYDPAIASPISWMARIARNQAIDLRRLRSERISDRSDPHDEDAISLEPDQVSMLEQSQTLRKLHECMTALSEESKSMVLLAYYEGWSREELAKKFERPVNTVKTALRRSLALLRECLDG
jgi:RNA polymerase sigma-70 factor (ECF subfamily)